VAKAREWNKSWLGEALNLVAPAEIAVTQTGHNFAPEPTKDEAHVANKCLIFGGAC